MEWVGRKYNVVNILNYYNNTGSKINKSIGIHYNDYDADNEKIKIWKTTNPNMNIYKIANRDITVTMDDKIKLYEKFKRNSRSTNDRDQTKEKGGGPGFDQTIATNSPMWRMCQSCMESSGMSLECI